MKVTKILSTLFTKRQAPKCETIAPELFNTILSTTPNKRAVKKLFKEANALPSDVLITSVQTDSSRNFYDTPGISQRYIDNYLGTFITFIRKNKPELGQIELKISDERNLPVDKSLVTRIYENRKQLIATDTFSLSQK